MTRKRRPLSVLALVAVIGVIGACGSAALAGAHHRSSAGNTDSVKVEEAVAVANARVARPAAPAGSLPLRSRASPIQRDRSISARSSAPSPTGDIAVASSRVAPGDPRHCRLVHVIQLSRGLVVDDGNSDGLSWRSGARVAGPVMSTPARGPLSAQPPTHLYGAT
jgi:hypothetical protein